MMREKGKVSCKLAKTEVDFEHDLGFRRAFHSDNYDFCHDNKFVPSLRFASV